MSGTDWKLWEKEIAEFQFGSGADRLRAETARVERLDAPDDGWPVWLLWCLVGGLLGVVWFGVVVALWSVAL